MIDNLPCRAMAIGTKSGVDLFRVGGVGMENNTILE